jgi:hypothetical protein
MTRERALIHRPGRGRRRHRAPPVDLARLVPIDKPLVRARYEFMETARQVSAATWTTGWRGFRCGLARLDPRRAG